MESKIATLLKLHLALPLIITMDWYFFKKNSNIFLIIICLIDSSKLEKMFSYPYMSIHK